LLRNKFRSTQSPSNSWRSLNWFQKSSNCYTFQWQI